MSRQEREGLQGREVKKQKLRIKDELAALQRPTIPPQAAAA
jgi:hypothetical protein